jgi:DNA-binding transcriptional ArsR family regulator
MPDNQGDSFNASKAEVFEALGHPTRIRLLQTLNEKPLPFSELKRAAGLESNGLLAFHLGKLSGLVRLNPEGLYALTDEGREALRIVEASKNQSQERPVQRPSIRVPHLNTVLAALVVVLVILASASAIEYNQIQGLDSRIQTTSSTMTGTTVSITTTMTSTATVEQVLTTTAVTDPMDNLQLRLSLNVSSSTSGVTVSTGVVEYNTLSSTNKVAAADERPLALNGLNGAPCWAVGYPVGVGIARGYYTSSNVTAATPLDIPPPSPGVTYGCPITGEFNDAAGYLFQPMNQTATSYGCAVSSCPTEDVGAEVIFTSFPRGVYTVMAEDEWGNLALAHFTIA